jgi:hypothetical protein
MTAFNALLVSAFLILVAASAAVVGSMIVLALFDLAFGKKQAPSGAVQRTEQDSELIEDNELNVSAAKPNTEVEADNVVPFKRTV